MDMYGTVTADISEDDYPGKLHETLPRISRRKFNATADKCFNEYCDILSAYLGKVVITKEG